MRPPIAMVLAVFVFRGASPGAVSAQEPAGASRMAALSRNAEVTAPPMQTPVLGFVSVAPAGTGGRRVHDAAVTGLSRTRLQVNALVGIPGSAAISGPLSIPSSVTSMHLAPGQGYAIVETEPGDSVALAQFAGTQVLAPTALPANVKAPDLISFSPNASAAALFSAAQPRLVVLTGLPTAPQVARQMESGALPGNIRELAIADDGATVMAGTSDGRVLLLSGDGTQKLLYSATDLGGIAFVPGSTDAVVFDREGGRTMLIASAATAPSMRSLAEGLAIPKTGVCIVQVDARSVLVSAIGATNVWRIDLQTGQVQDVRLSPALTMMQPLRAAGRYVLSAQPGQPAWVLDTSGETSTVFFVPRQMATSRVH